MDKQTKQASQPQSGITSSLNVHTPHYQQDVPFEIPGNWVWCKIEDIGEVITGNTPSKDRVEYYGGDTPFFKPTDLDQGIDTRYASDHLSELGFEQSRKLPVNTILVTCIGATIGKTGIITVAGSCNQQINAIVPNKEVTHSYIFYVCVSNYMQSEIISNASATTLPILNKSNFANLLFPLPPIAEQHRIVKEIGHWFALIDQIEQDKSDLQIVIKQAKSKILDLAIHGKLVPQDPNDEPAIELLKRINPDFTPCDNGHYPRINPDFTPCDNGHYPQLPKGWTNVTIKDICENINGLWKGKKEPFVNVGVIRNANFTKDFKLDYSNIEYIDVEQRAFVQRHLLNGDLIVEKSGGSDNNPVGRAVLYEGGSGVFSYSNFTMVLRIKYKELVLSKFLYYYILAKYKAGVMKSMQTQTTGLHNLILDKYLAMPLYLPPYSEQERIINKIEDMFEKLDAIMESL